MTTTVIGLKKMKQSVRERVLATRRQRRRHGFTAPEVHDLPRMVLAAEAPEWVIEARKLRRMGWSLPSLARRYTITQADVAHALGEYHERDW